VSLPCCSERTGTSVCRTKRTICFYTSKTFMRRNQLAICRKCDFRRSNLVPCGVCACELSDGWVWLAFLPGPDGEGGNFQDIHVGCHSKCASVFRLEPQIARPVCWLIPDTVSTHQCARAVPGQHEALQLAAAVLSEPHHSRISVVAGNTMSNDSSDLLHLTLSEWAYLIPRLRQPLDAVTPNGPGGVRSA
jgi:hypothetical protein